VSAQRGQIFRAPAGSWAIRYYDAHGRRRQKHGFRTKSEAKTTCPVGAGVSAGGAVP